MPPPAPQFTPRPDAHAMGWGDMVPPVRRAVHDLLLRLAGAEAARDALAASHPPAELGNSFLVYGARGTGKTTVLLTARQAVEHSNDAGYFRVRGAEPGPLDEAAQRWAGQLRDSQHIVWLDPLDLEPLPPTANLLTTLLTRVRGALDPAGQTLPSTASIFEESDTDARRQLDELVSDATLMWEEVQENDTRNKANRQRAAADIYSSFRGRFKHAMDTMSKRLDRWHGRDAGCAIVLPIDNIDRSTDHLKSIVKLAQMVAHPCLWLVMAGDRSEVETFLERAYWKELIQSQGGPDARGKTGQTGEDETLAMARRQGAAAAQKVWPPSHRVEVHALRPEETLAFHPPVAAGQRDSLRTLLGRIRLDSFIAQRGQVETPGAMHLIDLFDLTAKCSASPWPLSRAATKALCLPARSVLDLWQLAQRAAGSAARDATARAAAQTAGGPAPASDDDAVKLVRTMLRQVTAGSAMSSALSQRLQEEILRRDSRGATLLQFDRLALQLRYPVSLSSQVSLDAEPAGDAGLTVASSLQAWRNRDMLLSLALVERHEPDAAAPDLPELVSAWLTLLYDLLIFAPDLAVIGMATLDAPLVAGVHRLLLPATTVLDERELRQSWPAPAFSTFVTQDILWRRWEACAGLDRVAPTGQDPAPNTPDALALAWIGCALDTFELTRPDGAADCAPGGGPGQAGPLDRAAALHARLQSERSQPIADRLHVDSAAMLDWLERQLPLLFTTLCVPGLGADAARPSRLLDWLASHADNALVRHWRQHKGFLIADLDQRLARALPDFAALPATSRERLQDWAYGRLRAAL